MSRKNMVENFVCMDDVTGHMMEHNSVVYNPKTDDIETRKQRLHKAILEYYEIDLSELELDRLCSYDVNQLNDFVRDLSDIINEYK